MTNKRIDVDISAKPAGYRRGIDEARRDTRDFKAEIAATEVETRQLSGAFTTLRTTLAAVGLAVTLGQVISTADAMTNLESRIRLVTDSSRQLAVAEKEIYEISLDTRQSLKETGDLYFRIARGRNELNLTQKETLDLTETINQTVVLSGANATSAQAALIQFGQALSSGVLRGEELNSVLEQAPALSEAIAKGLGVTVGQLKAMGEAGELTVSQILEAIQKQAPEVAREFAKVQITVGGAMTNLQSALARYVGDQNEATGATSALAASIDFVAHNIDGFVATTLAVASVGLGGYIGKLYTARAAAQALEAEQVRLAASMGTVNNLMVRQSAAVGTAGVALTAARGIVATLGGPLGATITLLGLAATAWLTFGENAESSANQAATAAERAEEKLARFREQKLVDDSDGNQIAAELKEAADQYAAAVANVHQALNPQGVLVTVGREEVDKARKNLEKVTASYKEFQALADKSKTIGRTDFLVNDDFDTQADKVQKKLLELSTAFANYTRGLNTDSEKYRQALARFNAAKDEILEKAAPKGREGGNLYANEQKDLANLILEIEKAGSAEQSHTQQLQAKLDAYTHLDGALQEYLNLKLQEIHANEQLLAHEAAMNAGIDNEIARINEQTEAERQAAEVRENTAADLAERLRLENEDLNIALIADDKKRARAQLDIEYDRAKLAIDALVLEADERERLLDQEEQAYQKRLQLLDREKSAVRDLGLTFKSSFEDSVIEGQKLSEVLDGLGEDIQRLIARRTITDPIMRGVDGILNSSGFTDFLGSIFSSIFPSANGNAFSSAGVQAFASGGAFGNGEVLTQPTFFRFATGGAFRNGVAGEAGPEGALPLKRMSNGKLGVYADGGAGAKPNITVNLIESPEKAGKVEQRSDGGNGAILDVFVDRIRSMMTRDIQRGEGIAPALERTYGLNRAPGAY